MQRDQRVAREKLTISLGGPRQRLEAHDRSPRTQAAADQRELPSIGTDIGHEIERQLTQDTDMLDGGRHAVAQERTAVIAIERYGQQLAGPDG